MIILLIIILILIMIAGYFATPKNYRDLLIADLTIALAIIDTSVAIVLIMEIINLWT